ncbi:phosphoserine phosphatase SerB [Timonella senegalensis]|uniref:phosphoserine phosphatase SerB n=1 Tax=Timonella senegalensis TaxID=1465825 RepID=UPI0002D281A2|nr:phosphoserine phosphatase SerB [Timonella senegalensis]
MTELRAAAPTRLVVMDVDSTLIQQEVIEQIALHAGTMEQVAEVTERAMRGELDFTESLTQRVATLEGVTLDELAQVRSQIQFSEGAREFIAQCQSRGWEVALVSGGFTEIVAGLAAEVGISRFRANTLEVSGNALTGRTVGRIVDRAYKEIALREFAAELGLDMSQTVAMGDGANDLDMIHAAGVGIAFNAKPIVREQAPYTVNGSMLGALDIIDAHDAPQA